MDAPRLAEHDPRWAERFAAEAEAIADAFGDLVVAVEHVGSTAVEGLAAKPTIDIAVGVTTLDLPADAVARLVARGYEDARSHSRPGERRFRKGGSVPRDVIAHVVVHGGDAWRDYLAFRDALRARPELAREYEQLRRSLLERKGGWYSGVEKAALIRQVLGETRLETASAPETEALGARLAALLRPGDVVLVSGELGTGKTTFVRGACRALGVTDPVTSPTFTIGHRYRGRAGDVSHLDLYRFAGVSAAEWGDLEPYFDDAVAFVEWPEAGAGALPAARVVVRLAHAGGDRRTLTIAAAPAVLEALRAP